jgi:hypothetical protein
MANETLLKPATLASSRIADIAISPDTIKAIGVRPPIFVPHPIPSPPTPAVTVPPTPTPPTPAPPTLPPLPVVPAPPADSPFAHLPLPSPGDRIRADDFKALSQSLNILYNMVVLSASLFGSTLAEARAALTGQRYSIQRVMTVFGNEIANPNDTSLDSRKVIQVVPAAPGDPRVLVVVTEAVDTRRFAPNLIGLTYRDAASRIQTLLADVPIAGAPPSAPDLSGLMLTDAQQNFFK